MSNDWPDPEAALVERALKMQAGSILANTVLRLRSQVAALTAEHSGACDDMAQCTRCWERGQIDEAAQLRARVEALETAGDRLMAAARSLAYTWETDSSEKQMWEAWKKVGPAKDAWMAARRAVPGTGEQP